MLQFCKTRCTWIRSCWFPSLTVQDSFKILTHLKSIYTSLCLISFSLQKCIKIGKITIPRSRNFRLGREPSVTGRSPPNPSAPLERSSQAGNGSSVTPITGSPVFHPCYYGRTPFPPPPPRYTFPPSPLRRKSEPNRGASITRKDRNDEGRHVHVPIAHAGYRIRRARLPPPCSNRSAGVLLRGASRGCSRLQVHLALPPIRVERRRAFRRRALWSSDIIKAERSPWETGGTEPPDAPSAHRTRQKRRTKRRRREKARDRPRDRCCCHRAS